MKKHTANIAFIPHGGGPLPLLGEPGHAKLTAFLKNLPNLIARPEAIIVISAHWEAQHVMLTSTANPSLIYDYDGFPDESYHIQYPAPGHPALAAKLGHILDAAKIQNRLTSTRGLDHGVFVPLKIMYPHADIPCIQMSLLDSLSAEDHLSLGRGLRALKNEKILILGSGLSFHNMQAFRSPDIPPANMHFEQWLNDICCNPNLHQQQREQALQNWHTAPGAAYCHPRAEHLLPLHVCLAMADKPAQRIFFDKIMGKWASGFLWQ